MNSNGISKEHLAYLRKVRMRKALILSLRLFLLVAVFALWELMARMKLIDPFITSQPSRIVNTIARLYQEGKLFYHTGITCLETVIGFLLGTIAGTLTAIVLWWSELLSRVLEPYLVVLNSLPKIALGPIFIVWIGAGPSSIIAIALTISLIVTILEVLNGFMSVDSEKDKAGQDIRGKSAAGADQGGAAFIVSGHDQRLESQCGTVLGGRHSR